MLSQDPNSRHCHPSSRSNLLPILPVYTGEGVGEVKEGGFSHFSSSVFSPLRAPTVSYTMSDGLPRSPAAPLFDNLIAQISTVGFQATFMPDKNASPDWPFWHRGNGGEGSA